MSDNLKDTSNTSTLVDNTVDQALSFDSITEDGSILEFTDQDVLDYEEGTLTKKETAKFLLLSPLTNAIIKFVLIGLGLIGGIFWLISAVAPGFSNSMATTLYRGFTTVFATINNIFPFSVFEILIILASLGWLGYLAFVIVRFVQVHKKGKLLSYRMWIQFGYSTLAIVMFITMMMSFGYGVASNRSSFLTTYTDDAGNPMIVNAKSTDSALTETTLYIIDKLNSTVINTQSEAGDDTAYSIFYQTNGASKYSKKGSSTKLLSEQVNEAFKAAAQDIPSLKGPNITAKETLAGPIFTSMCVGSMYSPLTGEVLINPYYPEVAIPFQVAKAIAKERGFQNDSQADIIAYLVCTKYSDVPYIQYSGYFNAYLACGDKLVRRDKNMYATVASSLKESIKKEVIYYTKKIDSLYGNKSSLSFADSGTTTSSESYLAYPKLMVSYYRNNLAATANTEEASYGTYVNGLISLYQQDSDFQTQVDEVTAKYNEYIEEVKQETVTNAPDSTTTDGSTDTAA